MKDVIGCIDRDEVGDGVLADQQSIQKEHEIDDASTDQISACAAEASSHQHADYSEK